MLPFKPNSLGGPISFQVIFHHMNISSHLAEKPIQRPIYINSINGMIGYGFTYGEHSFNRKPTDLSSHISSKNSCNLKGSNIQKEEVDDEKTNKMCLSGKSFTCKDMADTMHDYIKGNLDIKTQKDLEEHLMDCPPCLAFKNTYKKTILLCEQSIGEIAVPKALKNKLMKFMKNKTGVKKV